jgi:hypothetical protein
MERPLFRYSAFVGLFLKIFKREKMIRYWGLIPILILQNSELQNSELRNSELLNSELWNSKLRHAVDYSENSGTGRAELWTSSSGLQ